MNILVIESSTTSAKAMVYNTETQQTKVVETPYSNQKTNEGLQDPDAVYSQTLRLARQICEGLKIDLIALSGTWHSVILCGLDMKPETPSFLWSYTGAKEICANLRKDSGYVHHYYKKTGCMVHSMYPFFKLKYIKEQGCDIESRFIMGQGSYNYFRLTGVRNVMDSMASGSGLLNINDLQFDRSLLNELGIHIEQLPVIHKWNDTNPLTPEAAKQMDLQAGIPVISAGPDGALNQVGSNALEEGIMTLSVGTSAALRVSVSKPRLSEDNSTWCYLSPKRWLSGAATSGACNCVDWIKSLLFPAGTTYMECEQGIGDIGKAPIFLPFLYGERCPGWNDERQALFSGVLPHHTAHEYYYSVLEGVLFNIYQCYRKLCNLNGRPKEIKISGGILNSPRWLQMCADTLNNELSIDTLKNSSMVGGIVLALEYCGVGDKSFGLDKDKKIQPDKEMHEKYMQRFNMYLGQYKHMF